MRWHEILSEGPSDTLLYHWMTMAKTEDVFDNDYMPAKWTHVIGGREILGNSFTRNKMFRFGEAHCVRLTVDKRALQYTNRIIPLDGELVHTRQHFPKSIRKDRVEWGKSGSQFAEEFVVGDIHDLSRCIVKVDVHGFNSGYFWSFCETVKQYCHTHDLDYAFSPDAVAKLKRSEDNWAEDR